MVHDPVGVCSIPGHHHDPELPDDHLHLRATQSGESFITTPCKTCHCLPTPLHHESWAMVWMEIESEFESISTAFGRNLELSRCGEWYAVDEIKWHGVKSYY